MPTPIKVPERADRDWDADAIVCGSPPQPESALEPLGEQLIREGREGHAGFIAGWSQFMDGLGIHGKSIEPKKLREIMLQEGIDPDRNEFSQGIISMREE